MQEPAYIMKNGKNVPYIPIEVTTAREAYAASLHVLFKHVADFHICIVKTFSAKYGIPEDDILKTIQESEEFKKMHVDPVLDTDSETLGYLTAAPVQVPQDSEVQPKEPEVQPKDQQVPAKKRIVKKKTVELIPDKKQDPVTVAIHEITTQEQHIPVSGPITVPSEKKRVIKKKTIASVDSLRTDTDGMLAIAPPPAIVPLAIAPPPPQVSSLDSNAGADVAKLLAMSDANGSHIQKKIIKKKK